MENSVWKSLQKFGAAADVMTADKGMQQVYNRQCGSMCVFVCYRSAYVPFCLIEAKCEVEYWIVGDVLKVLKLS